MGEQRYTEEKQRRGEFRRIIKYWGWYRGYTALASNNGLVIIQAWNGYASETPFFLKCNSQWSSHTFLNADIHNHTCTDGNTSEPPFSLQCLVNEAHILFSMQIFIPVLVVMHWSPHPRPVDSSHSSNRVRVRVGVHVRHSDCARSIPQVLSQKPTGFIGTKICNILLIVRRCFCTTFRPYVCLSVCLSSACLSVRLSSRVLPFIKPFFLLSVCLCFGLYVCPHGRHRIDYRVYWNISFNDSLCPELWRYSGGKRCKKLFLPSNESSRFHRTVASVKISKQGAMIVLQSAYTMTKPFVTLEHPSPQIHTAPESAPLNTSAGCLFD